MKPFTGRVKFFEDVLDHAMVFVHSHPSIILPAAFIGHVAVGFFASDLIVITSPTRSVHRVNVTARRISPIGSSFFGKRIRRESLIRLRLLCAVEVRIPSHPLIRNINKQLIDHQTVGRLCRIDAVLVLLPFQVQ